MWSHVRCHMRGTKRGCKSQVADVKRTRIRLHVLTATLPVSRRPHLSLDGSRCPSTRNSYNRCLDRSLLRPPKSARPFALARTDSFCFFLVQMRSNPINRVGAFGRAISFNSCICCRVDCLPECLFFSHRSFHDLSFYFQYFRHLEGYLILC